MGGSLRNGNRRPRTFRCWGLGMDRGDILVWVVFILGVDIGRGHYTSTLGLPLPDSISDGICVVNAQRVAHIDRFRGGRRGEFLMSL